MSAPARIGLVVAALVVAVVLFFVLRDTDEEAAEAPEAAATVATTGTDTAANGATSAETTAEEETAPPETTTEQEAPDVVRARITIGASGPSGVQRIVADRGQRVILTIASEVADHVHVHGYDLLADVGPGRPATIRFSADIPGRFEVELEDRGAQIAQLRVNP